ncbi:hypothetical protein JTE90_029290 [Oedothorax gibbosus]|uniref:RNA 3'-terminal phosphate cyclase-like protein n=1 Tax=Oedothorax gibbosus TaxID=931172 RepID=A0AAV6U3P3_9ARAC|nr:hypothetical protein JTE90_029290 [Oedothorax gibbosus]
MTETQSDQNLTILLNNSLCQCLLFVCFLILILGTVLKYAPGLLLGGKLQHDCGTERAIGYFLEPLLCFAPFCKKPLHITLKGITNDSVDPSVDAIKYSSLPVLKRFIINDENLEVKIISRGLPPNGGGGSFIHLPRYKYNSSIKIPRPRSLYSRKNSERESKGKNSEKEKKEEKEKKSPGFGLTLVAESTTGVFYSAEAISKPSGSKGDLFVPEDVAQQACFNLFEEINRGGCVDSNSRSIACLLMALGPADVSKIKTGPLSPYTIQLLRHREDFLQLRIKLDTEKDEKLLLGTNKVYLSCFGVGFVNLSRKVS